MATRFKISELDDNTKKYDVSAYTINELFYKFQIPSDNL